MDVIQLHRKTAYLHLPVHFLLPMPINHRLCQKTGVKKAPGGDANTVRWL